LEEKKPTINELSDLFDENVKKLALLLYKQQYIDKQLPTTDQGLYSKSG